MPPIVRELIGPSGLIFLGGLTATIGSLLLAARDSEIRNKSEGTTNLQTRLLQSLSARFGDLDQLEELIHAQARALTSDQSSAQNAADGILKRLPQATVDFKKLETTKLSAYEKSQREFRLKWQPFIEATLEKFDQLVGDCKGRGLALDQSSTKDFALSVDDQHPQNTPTLRQVTFRGLHFSIEYRPIAIFTSGYMPAQLSIKIEDQRASSMELSLGLDEGYCNWRYPDGPSDISSGAVKAANDGMPPKQFCEFVDQAISKLFERFLIMANANKDATEQSAK